MKPKKFIMELFIATNELATITIDVEDQAKLKELNKNTNNFFKEQKENILVHMFKENILNVNAEMPNAVKNLFTVYSFKTGGGLYSFFDDNVKVEVYEHKDRKDNKDKAKIIFEG